MTVTRTDRNQVFSNGDLLTEEVVEVDVTEEVNETIIRQAVRNHLADLRLITGSSGTLSGANLSNAVRTLAQGQIRVIRLLLNELDGTE